MRACVNTPPIKERAMLTLRELDVYLLADLLGVGGRDDPGLTTSTT